MPATVRNTRLPTKNSRPQVAHDPEQACRIWIDEYGQVLDCCEHTAGIFGYRPEILIGRHISLLLPHLSGGNLLKKGLLDPSLAFLCHCSVPFTTINVEGEHGNCLLFAYLVNLASGVAVALIVRPLPSHSGMDKTVSGHDSGYSPEPGQARYKKTRARQTPSSMGRVPS